MVVGIDLGTTNSVIAHYSEGRPRTLPVDGARTMPSVVSFEKNGTIHVGAPAKRRLLAFPGETVASSKRAIGREHEWQIHGKAYSGTDIAEHIIRKLVASAETALRGRVTEAVITIPAYFDEAQRFATLTAAERAGLKVLRLLHEPEAGAISYAINRSVDQTLLVYDLGGGTFDITVLQVADNLFRTRSIEGNSLLGGNDFDHLLATLLAERLQGDSSFARNVHDYLECLTEGHSVVSDIEDPKVVFAAKALIDAAERAKIELSELEETTALIPQVGTATLDTTVTRHEFESLIQPLVDQTIRLCESAVRQASLDLDDISKILLVGGSTKTPLIRSALKRFLKEPWTSDDVDEAVAWGAAVFAASLDGVTRKENPTLPKGLSTVLPQTVGVRVIDEEIGDHIFFPIVPKNAPVPSEVFSQTFFTMIDNQKQVKIAVLQGEDHDDWTQNTFIGGFRLNIPPRPANSPVEVRIRINEGGLLEVTGQLEDAATTTILDTSRTANLADFDAEDPTSSGASIMFFVDTSGSMSREITGVRDEVLEFASYLEREGLTVDVGLLDFAYGSKYLWEIVEPRPARDFLAAPMVRNMKTGRLSYGGCYVGDDESHEVIKALTKAFPKNGNTRTAILISDETCASPKRTTVDKIIQTLRKAEVRLFVIGVDNSGCHREIAEATNGQFWSIKAVRNDFGSAFRAALGEIAKNISDFTHRS